MRALLFALVLVAGLLPAQTALATGAGSVTALHKNTAGNEVSGDISMTAGDTVELGWDVVSPDGVETSYSDVNWTGGGSAPGVKGVTWSSTDGALPSGSTTTNGSVISFNTATSVGNVPPYAGVLYSITGLYAGTTKLTITVTFDDDSTATDTITVNVASRPDGSHQIIAVGSIGLDHDAGDGTFASGDFSVDVGSSIQVHVPYSALPGVSVVNTSIQYDSSVISMGPIDPMTQIATVKGLQAGSTTLSVTLALSDGIVLSISVLVTVPTPGAVAPVTQFVTLTDGNVTVYAVLPDTVKLEVTPLTQETDPRYGEFQVAVGNMQILGLYDIKLVDTQTGEYYELPADSQAIVVISGFAFTGAPTVKVAHQKEDGSLEYLSNEVGGDEVVFVASSFSLYGVLTEPGQNGSTGKDQSSKGTPTNNDRSSQTKVPPLSSPSSGSRSNLPKTGDTAGATMLEAGNLLLIGALAVALVLTSKRKLSWRAFFLKE